VQLSLLSFSLSRLSISTTGFVFQKGKKEPNRSGWVFESMRLFKLYAQFHWVSIRIWQADGQAPLEAQSNLCDQGKLRRLSRDFYMPRACRDAWSFLLRVYIGMSPYPQLKLCGSRWSLCHTKTSEVEHFHVGRLSGPCSLLSAPRFQPYGVFAVVFFGHHRLCPCAKAGIFFPHPPPGQKLRPSSSGSPKLRSGTSK